MAQLTIYLQDDLLQKVKRDAKDAGVSQSQWVADAVRARAKREWPAAVKALAGSWPDAPLVEEIRKLYGTDVPRENL